VANPIERYGRAGDLVLIGLAHAEMEIPVPSQDTVTSVVDEKDIFGLTSSATESAHQAAR